MGSFSPMGICEIESIFRLEMDFAAWEPDLRKFGELYRLFGFVATGFRPLAGGGTRSKACWLFREHTHYPRQTSSNMHQRFSSSTIYATTLCYRPDSFWWIDVSLVECVMIKATLT